MTVPKEKNNFWLTFITGGFSGVCGKTMIAPIERVKYIFVVPSADIQPCVYVCGRLAGVQVDRH